MLPVRDEASSSSKGRKYNFRQKERVSIKQRSPSSAAPYCTRDATLCIIDIIKNHATMMLPPFAFPWPSWERLASGQIASVVFDDRENY